MPRQPYLRVVPQPRGAKIDIGALCAGQRPELERLVANCLMAWPPVEAEMALLLGQLLGSGNVAALAVFQARRRSSAQRDAISEAARASLSDTDQELLSAILNVHKATETERTALAHGHFGTSSKLPDALIWQSTNDYIKYRAQLTLVPNPSWDDNKHAEMLASISVYRAADLTQIYEDFLELSKIWFDSVKYFQQRDPHRRAELYRQLCDQPRIAQELAKLRREKNPPTPTLLP